MSVGYLFSRIEQIFKFYQLALISADYEIKVYCYTPADAELIKTKLKTVRESFEELTEYSMLLLVFDDIAVIPTERHYSERYEVFKNLKNEIL